MQAHPIGVGKKYEIGFPGYSNMISIDRRFKWSICL